MSGKISLSKLSRIAKQASAYLSNLTDKITEPYPTKKAPTFNSNQIAALCGIERNQITYLTEKHSLPKGLKPDGAKAKQYSLEETILWVQTIGKYPQRPQNKKGKIYGVVNYKGGVQKSTTTECTSQGLSLQGLKVLKVDLDPQGTLTRMSGLNPENPSHVDFNDTIMPFISQNWGDFTDTRPPPTDLRYAIKKTFWHNIDLIPASSAILTAEYAIPMRIKRENPIDVLHMLRNGLEPLLDTYDVILIDTSPSMSHLTVNAMFASDGIIMPCPPATLDFVSSVQFWDIFDQILEALGIKDVVPEKEYDFIEIVRTRYIPPPEEIKLDDDTTKRFNDQKMVSDWMEGAYPELLSDKTIRESVIARKAASFIKTVYELPAEEMRSEAYRKYRDDLDKFVNHIANHLYASWGTK